MRREERNRRVAPIVNLARRTVLGIELENRQQLDRRNPELFQIGNLLDQAGIRSTQVFLEAGARMPGEAADVHLVDDGPGRWSF